MNVFGYGIREIDGMWLFDPTYGPIDGQMSPQVRMHHMIPRLLLGTMAIAALATGVSADQRSRAAQYLIDQQIAESCDSGGRFEAWGIVEIDLTGDGRRDLLLNHDALVCNGRLFRSLNCGAALCSVYLFVREGELLQPKEQILSARTEILPGRPPTIRLHSRQGMRYHLRWNGSAFAE